VLADETAAWCWARSAPRAHRGPVREELQKAEEDDNVKALIVRINSPGGTITASDLIYREIDVFKTRRKVPVIAVMMDVAASGGYYAALAGDTIMALPTTVTGSIGVVMLTVNAPGPHGEDRGGAPRHQVGRHEGRRLSLSPLSPSRSALSSSR
jgi:membrane-bound ClpP family serine protease